MPGLEGYYDKISELKSKGSSHFHSLIMVKHPNTRKWGKESTGRNKQTVTQI